MKLSTHTPTRTRALALASSALVIALALAGCSGSTTGMNMDGSGPATAAPQTAQASSDYNDPDIAFATQMIPHHQQAVEMVDIVLAKTGVDARVTKLARTIKAEQGPEITTMTAWLKTWGQPSPATMVGMAMDGMMSAADMDDLRNASGPDSSKLFLEQMIQHHQGAIDMANTELASGKNPEALALAKSIVRAQTAEIATMKELLTEV